jgi:PKD repeat protein
VIWSGSRFIAAGDRGTILTSPDGRTWTAMTVATADLHDLASDGALLVAVGTAGSIISSSNGSTWNAEETGIDADLTAVVWTGELFVAAGDGGVLLTSPDGHSWSSQSSGTDLDLISVTGNGERLVMVNRGGQVASSSDGIGWSSWSSSDERIRHIEWCGEHFIAVGGKSQYSGYLGLSDDGFDWRWSTTWYQLWELNDIACGPETTIAVGRGGEIVESYDQGEHWHRLSAITEVPLRALASNGTSMIAVGGYLEHAAEIPVTAVTSDDGAVWQGLAPLYPSSNYDIAFGNGIWVAVGSYSDPYYPVGRVLYGPYLTNWSSVTASTSVDRSPQRLLAVSWDGERFVAAGDDGVVGSSEDGASWVFRRTSTSASLHGVTSDADLIVAVGAGAIVTGKLDVGWSTIGIDQDLWAVTRGNGQLVAVGEDGLVLTSMNGEDWSEQSSGISQTLFDVTWTGERFLAAGAGGVVISSADGWQWQQEATGLFGTIYAIAEIGEQVIAVGEHGLIQRTACREPEEPPVAGFSWRPSRVEVGRQVSFVDLSTGDPTSWEWDFGDGGGETVQSPTHSYTSAGTYPVTLRAGNQRGSTTSTVSIEALDPCNPVAAPELTVPAAVISDLEYTIDWTETLPSRHQGHYLLEESTDPLFDNASTTPRGASIGSMTLSTSSLISRDRYYRVRAERYCFDGNYPSAWSETGQIVVIPTPEEAGEHAQVVPAVAHTSGLEGTEWRSDLVLHNPSHTPATALIALISGSLAASQEVTIEGGQSLLIEDVVGVLAPGLETSAALLIDSDQPLQVSSRTYNNQPDGSYGQLIGGLPLSAACRSPQRAMPGSAELAAEPGQTWSFQALDPAVRVSLEGVRWPVTRARLDLASTPSTSNIAESKLVKITVEGGPLIVIRSDLPSHS